ncbi:MAG: AbrB/MazE/SpoVT family DNA-binding domain-containing protein [Clostridiales bacterium]|nr:AbrB/MazE/SpoVT family DNA-binding domain-containing protein [Clostridiales bacterium]
MEVPQGKHAWMIKIGEKGQFVIPKEARDMFDFQPGQTILVLADEKRGLAIPPRADSQRIMSQIIDELQKEGE